MFDIIKVIILGIVEGITEWLPISSTGHLILLNEFIQLGQSEQFKEMFFVVIQFGAILAVVGLYFGRLFPYRVDVKTNRLVLHQPTVNLWGKILVACLPAAIIGLLFDDIIDKYLYNPMVVGIMLISFGIGFVWIEKQTSRRLDVVTQLNQITYSHALVIGFWQLIAAIFPGTSRSGATIIGGMMLGLSRSLATEFTFFLAVPVMFGASLLKLVKFGFSFSLGQLGLLLLGCAIALITSMYVIKFLLNYLKKNNFTGFGYYRIGLGSLVIVYFGLKLIFKW